MYTFYLLLIAAFAASSLGISELRAQQSEWVIYSDMQHTTNIAQEGNVLWVISASGVAQVNRNTLEVTLVTREDMSLPTILSFAVQKNGKKWFGTQFEGLIMLDNDQVKIFTPQNSPVRIPNPVAQGDNIWMRGGIDTLIRYDGQEWYIIDVSDVAEGTDKIGSLYGDAHALWAGSFLYGSDNAVCTAIYRLDNGEWNSIPLPVGSNFTSISPVGSRNGVLWLSGIQQTDNLATTTLMRYDGSRWTTFTGKDLGASIKPQTLMIDSSGQVWLPTAENTILRYDGTTWHTINLTDTPLDSANITAMFTDSDCIVWVGTEKKGLFQYNNNLWLPVTLSTVEMPTYTPSHSPSGDASLSSITVDTDQSLWLNYGTNIETQVNGETGRIQPLPFGEMYTEQYSAMDQIGNRWIASVYGLWRRSHASWEKVSDERFTSLYIDRSNNLWLGTPDGVARYNNNQWTYYSIENSDFYSKCIAVTEDKNGALWAVTADKLLAFDGNTWTELDTQYPPNLFGETPYHTKAMIADSTGLLWLIPDYEQKIFTFDGTTWKEYNAENAPLAGQSCVTILADRTGNVWIGAVDVNKGLGYSKLIRIDYATKEWAIFTPKNSPLPYEIISCMAVDSSNNLWIGMIMPHKLVGYREGGVLVDVDEQPQAQTPSISLRSFPNPTASHTTLRYSVPPSTGIVPVRIQLFNSLGMPVATLEESHKNPGEYNLDVDVTTLATGTYYYRLQIGSSVQTQQLVVVK